MVISLLIFLALGMIFPALSYAVCPVCTVAVGAGLGISRWLGIDDVITGVWVGGLVLSSGFWLSGWLGKRGWQYRYRQLASVAIFYLFVIPPMYLVGMIGILGNTFLGIDKLLVGIILGSVGFLAGVWTDRFLRKTNNGKVYIYYQKVIAPVLILTIISFMLYLLV